jgi:uncharacterized coiled-coil DUF342 family protein
MRHERDELRVELVDLRSQVPALRHTRDELLATVEPLRAQVTDLRLKQRELRSLTSELQARRDQKSSLDRRLAELRRLTARTGGARTGYRNFHDS